MNRGGDCNDLTLSFKAAQTEEDDLYQMWPLFTLAKTDYSKCTSTVQLDSTSHRIQTLAAHQN